MGFIKHYKKYSPKKVTAVLKPSHHLTLLFVYCHELFGKRQLEFHRARDPFVSQIKNYFAEIFLQHVKCEKDYRSLSRNLTTHMDPYKTF